LRRHGGRFSAGLAIDPSSPDAARDGLDELAGLVGLAANGLKHYRNQAVSAFAAAETMGVWMRTIAWVATGVAAIGLVACSKPTFKEYAYPDLNFAATFQAPPKVTVSPASKDGATPASTLVDSDAFGLDFAVNVIDASSATESTDEMLDAAPDAVGQARGMDVGPRTHAAVGRINGREVRFDKDGKPVMLMRFFFASDKFYEVNAYSTKGLTDPRVRAFLDSFRLLQGPGAEKAKPAAPASNAAPVANAAPAAANAPSP